jgi:putative ABC transport system ATP-binding protein
MIRERPAVGGEALRLTSISKSYGTGEGAVTALDHVSLNLPEGSFMAVMGPSGSGKSTLLRCAAGLDHPDSGQIVVDGEPMTGRSEAALTKFRRKRIGFVFQQYNLLPTLTVFQNTVLPLRLSRTRVDRDRALRILSEVGLADRVDHLPDQLSGGQRQRVAIARALVTGPKLVFADEPTGALDLNSARDVLRLLRAAAADHGQTVVMVTHDPVAASHADFVQFLADGRLVDRLSSPTADAVAERLAHLGDAVARSARFGA